MGRNGLNGMNVEVNTLSTMSAAHMGGENPPNESAVAIKIYDEQ